MTENDGIEHPDAEGSEGFQIWHRLPKETRKAYAAFCVYRDIGEYRSIRKAFELMRKSKRGMTTAEHRHWEEWSVKNRWVERTEAFDAFEQDKAEREAAEARRAARDRRLDIAHLQQAKALEKLQSVSGLRIPVKYAMRLLEYGLKNERLEMGEAIDRREMTGPGGKPLETGSVTIYIPDNGRDGEYVEVDGNGNGASAKKHDNGGGRRGSGVDRFGG